MRSSMDSPASPDSPATCILEVGPSRPQVEVRVRLAIFDVTEISIPSSRFTCSFFLEASWEDPQLDTSEFTSDIQDPVQWDSQFPYRSKYSDDNDKKKRWTPRLDFDNIVELKDKEDWFRVYTQKRDNKTPLPRPVVCYRLRATGVFRERFELERFPFDSQDLQMQMVSRHPFQRVITLAQIAEENFPGGQSCVKLVMNRKEEYKCVCPGHDKDKFTLYDEYKMSPHIIEMQGRTLARHSTTGQCYPLLILSMKVTRRPRFYLWHVYLPMSAFVFLTFPVLLLGVDELSDRLQNIFALLLAAISYKGWLGEALPRCSYLTRLDQYVLFCIALIFIAAIESAILFMIHKRILESGHRMIIDTAEDFLGIVALLLYTLHCYRLYRRGVKLENAAPLTGIEQMYEEVRYKQSVDDSPGRCKSRLPGYARSPTADFDRSAALSSNNSSASWQVPPDFRGHEGAKKED